MSVRRIRCVLISLLGALVMLTVGAAPASAASPPSVTIPAGVVCPFQVTLTAVEFDDFMERTLPRNTVLTTFGALVVEVTNDETGESVVRDISGPATVTQTGETTVSVLLGPSLLILLEGDDATGKLGQGLFYQPRGLAVFRGFTLIRVVGPTENLCVTLAP